MMPTCLTYTKEKIIIEVLDTYQVSQLPIDYGKEMYYIVDSEHVCVVTKYTLLLTRELIG